jgi:putative hydrolase of HD superfamily
MAMMTMFAPSLGLDTNKCIKMSLIHDLAESLVGDITPADGVPKTEKNRRETIVIKYLTEELLGTVYDGSVGREMLAIWQEFEDSKTPESQFTQDVDKLELLLQMMEYERRGDGMINLQEFTYVTTKLQLEETKPWANEILKERDEFWRDRQSTPHSQGGDDPDQMKMLQDQYYGD